MATFRYLILGAGGAGRTAAAVLERWLASQGRDALREGAIAFLDDRLSGQVINGYPVVGRASEAQRWLCPSSGPKPEGLVAFGTSCLKEREAAFQALTEGGASWGTAVDPSAAVDRTARIGRGTVIAAQCAVNPNAVLGENGFLCVATTVDHDVVLGDHVYCSPGVNLAGAAVVEAGVMLGTNATVLPCVRIGRGAVVGAGAVVRKDVPAGATVVGNPARVLRVEGALTR